MCKYTLFLFLSLPVLLSAQLDTMVFRSTKKIQTTEFTLDVPERWRNTPYLNAGSKDQRYEFSEVSLPLVYNNTPVTAVMTLRKFECANIRQAEDYILTEMTSYPDRVTSGNFNYSRDSLVIASGETATFYHTRYYRRAKASNFTNYYLVAYSEKRKAAYMINITFQYRDSTYEAEEAMKFKEYVLRVLNTFVLR
ncbi:MAG: hypothetical protein IPP77_00670 [Bacteroidetes bacterium]|nr:hypothetical protein [Bacteroidota bacterium]